MSKNLSPHVICNLLLNPITQLRPRNSFAIESSVKNPIKNWWLRLPWLITFVVMATITDLGSQTLWYSLNINGSSGIASAQKNTRQTSNDDEDQIKTIARQTTVRIAAEEDGGSAVDPGSGVIIGKKDNTYYVLTCLHVIRDLEDYDKDVKSTKLEITTPDGQKHGGRVFRSNILYQNKQVDLAVVTFKSNRTYRTAELASSLPNIYERRSISTNGNVSTSTGTSSGLGDLTKFPAVVIAGFPLSTSDTSASGKLETSAGYLVNTTASAFSLAGGNQRGLGYRLMYTNLTRVGMSGGPVFNAEGRVIGIHGMTDGTVENASGRGNRIAYNLSLAIPIPIFIKYGAEGIPTEVNSKKVTKNLNLSKEKWVSPNVHDRDTVSYNLEAANQAWRLGGLADAKELYAKSLNKIDQNSTKREDIISQAEVLFLQGFSAGWYRDFNTAYESCKKASELVETQNLEGIFRLEQNKKTAHKQLLNLSYRSWRCRAGAAFRRGNPDLNEALTSLERAIEINRFSQEQKRASWREQREATEQGQTGNNTTNPPKPLIENPNDYLERGQILMYQQEWIKATSSFRFALELDPDFWMPRTELAFAYLETDRIDDAEKEARRVLNQSKQIDPENPYGPSYTVLVRVQIKRNNLQGALDTVNEGLRWVTNDPSLHDDRGVILATMGRKREAREAFLRALKIDSDYVDAARHLQEIGEN